MVRLLPMALVAVPVGALWAIVLGGEAPSGPIRLANPFFAMDTNFRQAEYRTAARQAEVLAELGYAGSDQTGLSGLADRLKCYDAKGVKLYACYVTIMLGTGKDPLPPAAVKEAITTLKGRDVKLWLAIRHPSLKPSDPGGDEMAAKLVGELAAACEPAGLGIALYPHSGFWLERVEDAVRLAKKVGCKNVGATFNLCHWLNVTGGKDDVKALLTAASPNLAMVTINGADASGRGWGQLIQPLDQGTYDVRQVLAALKEIGYAGPVGLQGFGIRGDSGENLARSMAAWRKMTGQAPPRAAASPETTAVGRAAAVPSAAPPPAAAPAKKPSRLFPQWDDFAGQFQRESLAKMAAWAHEEGLPPSELALQPGDLAEAFNGRTGDWKIVGDVSLDPADPRKLAWKDGDGIAVNGPTGRTAHLVTKAEIGDCVAVIQFMIAKGSNSGVYFQGRYEVQIYDSFGVEKDKYPGLECGGIYPRTVGGKTGHSPRANASRQPGQWQTFGVYFRAPRFDAAGKKTANAKFEKVYHNGKLIHENIELTGPTAAPMFHDEKPTGPLMLQGDHGPVAYRYVLAYPLPEE